MLNRSPATRNAFLALVLLGLAAAPSCGVTADVDPPSLNILSASPEAQPDSICGTLEPVVYPLLGGDTLVLELELTDNEALSQLKTDIHANFDCHGHARMGRSARMAATAETQDWSLLELIDLGGTEEVLTVALAAPANPTAGAYHFQMRLVDAAGNEDPNARFVSIRLRHPDDTLRPQLMDLSPVPGTALSGVRGEALDFDFRLEDNRPLGEGGNGRLVLYYVQLSNGNRFKATDLVFEASEGATATGVFSWTPPTTLTTGEYILDLQAFDGVNNASSVRTWSLTLTD